MQHIRRWRLLGGVFALVMVLSSISSADAAVTQNLQNPSFGTKPNCNLQGWTTSGLVAPSETYDLQSANCVAQLTAISDLSLTPAYNVVSKIEQSFVLSQTDPTIYFDCLIMPGSAANVMRFRLYTAGGDVVYAQDIPCFVGDVLTPYSRSFPQYAGQSVRLSLEFQVINAQQGMRNQAQLKVDFQYIATPEDPITPPDPEPAPGGGA